MGFDFNVLQGVSRAAVADKARRDDEEEKQQTLLRQTAKDEQQGFLRYLDTIAGNDLAPETMRSEALKWVIRLAANGSKTTSKEYPGIADSIWRSSMRPGPVTPEQSAGIALERGVSNAAPALDAMMGGGFGSNALGVVSQQVSRLPRAPQREGLLQHDELQTRDEDALRRRTRLQQELAPPQWLEVEPGKSLIDPRSGRRIEGPPAPTKRDYSVTPFEVLMDPNATPEQKATAERILTVQHTNQGDTPRSTSSTLTNVGTPILIQNPDGSLKAVYPKTGIGGGSPVEVSLGDGQKPMNDTAKDKKANMEGLLRIASRVASNVDKNSGAIGVWDNWMGRVGEFTGWNSPETTILRTDVRDMASQLGLLRSGQAVSEQEAQRLASLLPSTAKSEADFKAKAQRFVEELTFILQRRYGPGGLGDATGFNGDVRGQVGSPARLPSGATTPPGVNPNDPLGIL